MKDYFPLLVILLAAHCDCCSRSSGCRMANWWDSFDREGWSYCRSYEYVTGFFRSHRISSDPIERLEKARCCKAPSGYEDTSSTCEYTNWLTVLDGLVLKTKSD